MSWPQIRISEVAEIVSGATPKTGEPKYWGGEIAWATPADLSGLAGTYIDDTPRKITEVGLRSCAASILPVGSVLFSSRAPIGHVAINTAPMATNQGFKSFVPNTKVLDAKFLFWWLKAHRAQLEAMGSGATFKEVSKATVSRVEIPLPPLDEQKRIAAILDKADQLRQKRRQALALLDSLTQSIFLEMFGDPVSNPKGWRKAKFTSLLAEPLRNGVSPSSSGDVDFEVLTLSAITGQKFDQSAKKLGKFQALPPARQRVTQQDFLICRGNGNRQLVGRGLFPDRDMSETAFPDTIIAGRIDEAMVQREFLEAIWNGSSVRTQIEASARTTNGTYKVNQGVIENIEIILPDHEAQKQYSAAIGQIKRELNKHLQGFLLISNSFSSLQDRAFTGQL